MKVIVGLGNPGKKYDNTRHNIGFEALDYIADKEGININTGKYKALIGTGYMGGEKVLLVKPQTFMNLSGESLRPIMDFYKLDLSDILVIYDDISLEPGMLRLRTKGMYRRTFGFIKHFRLNKGCINIFPHFTAQRINFPYKMSF